MTYSVNELEMLAQKAARGAGAFPAQAAHFGKVCVIHLAADRPEEPLLVALNALPGGPIQTLPIRQELSATDPFEQSYAVMRLPPDERPDLPVRLSCPDALYDRLTALATKILVPASEASRNAGAGAGANDTD